MTRSGFAARAAVVVTVTCTALYYGQSAPGFLLVVSCLPLFGLMFYSVTDALEEWVGTWLLLCVINVGLFVTVLNTGGLRVNRNGDGAVEVKPLFSMLNESLGIGYSFDVVEVAMHYKKDVELCNGHRCEVFDICKSMVYVLRTGSVDRAFDKYKLILEARDIQLIERDLGHGDLTVIRYTDERNRVREIDLHGNDINAEGYEPFVSEPIYLPDVQSPHI